MSAQAKVFLDRLSDVLSVHKERPNLSVAPQRLDEVLVEGERERQAGRPNSAVRCTRSPAQVRAFCGPSPHRSIACWRDPRAIGSLATNHQRR